MLPTTSIVLRNEETKKKQTNKAMHLRFRWIPSKYGFFCRLQCFEVCFAVFCCVLACVSRCPIVFVCGSVADFRTFPLSMFLVSQVAIPLLVIWAGILLLLSGISCDASLSNVEHETLFRLWKTQCRKSYGDVREESIRLENFRSNLDRIEMYNIALRPDQRNERLSMNLLGDLSEDELLAANYAGDSFEMLFSQDSYSCDTEPLRSRGVGSIPSRIASSMRAYIGHSTAGGPGGGTLACAWAVNNIMSNAGLRKIGENPNYVPSVAAALRGHRGVAVSRAHAVAGDIAIACGEGHIGICSSDKCDTIESNSSSRRCFCWSDSYSGFSTYFGCPPSLYRVTN